MQSIGRRDHSRHRSIVQTLLYGSFSRLFGRPDWFLSLQGHR
jgi:hypothetical protein